MTNQPSPKPHGTKVPWVTLALCTVLILLQAYGSKLFGPLAFDRTAVLGGQIWRLLTGHLVHLDWSHLAANVAALLCLGSLVETDPGSRHKDLLAVLIVSMLAVALALLAISPSTAYYAGLSGALNGLFVLVCLRFYARTRSNIWLVLLIGDMAKIGWESIYGPLFTPGLPWPPEPLAHFAGALAGIGLFVASSLRAAKKSWYFPWASCPLIPS